MSQLALTSEALPAIKFKIAGAPLPQGSKVNRISGKRVKHGERCKSPSNWSVFWSSVKPAPTPVPCTIVRTGGDS